MSLPPGWRLEHHAALTSTSDLAIARAEAGESAGLAIMADRQTAGRGRSGRTWESPLGNLHLSMLLRPGGAVREAPQWSLLAAVALFEAARQLCPGSALRLKWPNDLLLDGTKCAGILAESSLGPQGELAWLVLGVGVNLVRPPALADRPAAALDTQEPARAVAELLLHRLGAWTTRQATEGFAPIRAAWMDYGPELGAPLAVRTAPGAAADLHGTFAGLADDGSLRLRGDGRVRRVAAGEIGRG